MESCHSVLPSIIRKVPHPPTYHRLPPKIYSTLGHLVEIIERLGSPEELGPVLRRIVAEGDELNQTKGQGSNIDLDPETIIKVARILRRLNSNCATPSMATDTLGTNVVATSSANLVDISGEIPGSSLVGGARAQRAADGRNFTLSKQDSLYLVKKIKDFEQKCKPLQEKNKKFLEKNMELTSQNRSLKDQTRNIADENKKLKDHLDQCRRKCSALSRQMNQEKLEKGTLEEQTQEIQKLREQVAEQNKHITSLTQVCAEKDRRMEVLQHRKKRRLRLSTEYLSRLSSPCSGVDDEHSQDSDLSQSSVSAGTLSDDELLEDLPNDDVERLEKNYKKLSKEHLALQKSMAQLQGVLGCRTDPQRFVKMRTDYETDIYVAQCKIENLEECLDKYKNYDTSWVLEKGELCSTNQELSNKVEELSCNVGEITEKYDNTKDQLREITQLYEESQDQIENMEFLVLETQESCDTKSEEVVTCDVSMVTEPWERDEKATQEIISELEAVRCSEATLKGQLEMSTQIQDQYRGTIKGLEEKLTRLLEGQGSEVNTVMSQLKQAEQHINDVESTMQEFQDKIVTLQQDKATLSEKLAQYRSKLDSQEQCMSLTRDEREELMTVKHKPSSHLNNRLKLAEKGHDSVRDRSLDHDQSFDEGISQMVSPRPRLASDEITYSQTTCSADQISENENEAREELFEQRVSTYTQNEPVIFENTRTRQLRINSVPVLGLDQQTGRYGNYNEVDALQKQIAELQDENDVLKFELTQNRHGDSDGSGSESEDSRIVELQETCETLRDKLHTVEQLEKQYKEKVKLLEKHVSEIEQSETVLRDRVEEGNADCDKLRKQIVRLQRKLRDMKDVSVERETNEQALLKKLKYLEEAESLLSRKVTELEGTNQILKQRIDLKDELLGDVDVVTTLKEKVMTLESENNEMGSKIIELEEDNEVLRDNWRKVADEEANRRESLEEKIRLLECKNKDLKTKLKENECDLDLSSCPSIASEINEDTIDQLNLRIQELETELQNLNDGKNLKLEALQDELDRMSNIEIKLTETLAEMENSETQMKDRIALLEKSKNTNTAVNEMMSYQDKITHLKSSQENLLERLDSMEDHEDDLKEKMVEMEKVYDKKLEMLEREIAEFQQQEDDLCARIEELVENESVLNKDVEKFKENEIILNNRIEEFENRETSLTVSFSQRVGELESKEQEIAAKFTQRIEELKKQEVDLTAKIDQLESEKTELLQKVVFLEKHEKELSEKVENQYVYSAPHIQENSELLQSGPKSNIGTLELQNTVENIANIQSETSASLKLINQNDSNAEVLKADNQTLKAEISKLQILMKESEKEQKSLSDKLKKQEKKRKKSQRTDNLEDYDSLAREVVTYKLEVEQLRTENTDLHDRVMELDESEKTLLEKNEQLQIDFQMLETSSGNDTQFQEKETELQTRISDLEKIENTLRNEIVSLKNGLNIGSSDSVSSEHERQSSTDSAYESSKEVAKSHVDKAVGTGDFMEGVMGGQEQGKPVSSMFERIQVMEAENQELTTKLSVLTATDAQVRQLSEKVKGLEENEDSLMERVMELEDEEDRLKRELVKARRSSMSVSELEEELCTMQETEKELSSTIEKLEHEKLTLKKSFDESGAEKGDIAVRYASVMKLYEDEKKKVESLLKGEERWMKSGSSDKKAIKEMESELANTQEKLEELQTDYETRLSEKDESEKCIKEELNKILREKESLKKKFQEYEKSNSELEDEIEACKISESRMFHRHQQLITQNQDLELKLSKLMQLLPYADQKALHQTTNKDHSVLEENHLMSENPEVVSENPLSTSIFTETELELLRSKTPDTELLGSVPLEMLRKIQEFDQREINYQSKIHELELKSVKLIRKLKTVQGREKDLKHEIKELQLELMNHRESTSSLRASTSSLDKSVSEDGLDSDNQSSDGHDDLNSDIFKLNNSQKYDNLTREQLLLSVKLFEEKQDQDIKKQVQLEDWISCCKDILKQLVELVTSDSLDMYLQNVETFNESLIEQPQCSNITPTIRGVLDCVTSLRQRLQAIQDSEQRLRINLAENEIVVDKMKSRCEHRVQQLESQVQVLAKVADIYPPTASTNLSGEPVIVPEHNSRVEAGHQPASETDNRNLAIKLTQDRFTSPVRDIFLETSQTINIDVPPFTNRNELGTLVHSKTITVDVAPSRINDGQSAESEEDLDSDTQEATRMMDKAEDVFRQRIKELEKLEKHLKHQVHDLEADRDELHDITRKDKNIIHEQNVKLRELQLSQRNLQEQIKIFENSENTLYARLDEMENEMENKDDRIRDLEILEGRLKDLVKQYKLDGKILVTKSETLETSVLQMTAKEETLKEKVQNLESEKSAFSERSEYLQMRLKELENAEMDLAQRAKSQENVVQSLQNTVMELETFGANAHARVVELEQVNFELQQRLHHAMVENSPLSKQLSDLQQKYDAVSNELSALQDSNIRHRQESDSLGKSETTLQQEVKHLRIKEVELDAKVRDLEESETLQRDKLSKLQRSENTLKHRVQELENSGIQAPSDLSTSLKKENVKLPRTLEDCQRRIIMLQANNAELQERVGQYQDISGNHGNVTVVKGTIQVPQTEYQVLQKKVAILQQTENQLEQTDRLNTHLQETVEKLREGKDVCGHEVEVEVLRSRLAQANQSVKLLQNPQTGQWISQGPNVLGHGRGQSPRGQEEGLVVETMTKSTSGNVQSRAPGQMLSRDRILDDLMASLQATNQNGGSEDEHWREIESRMETNNSRGSEKWISVGKATSMYANADGSTKPHSRSHNRNEELELGLALQSETESQFLSQNDTGSVRRFEDDVMTMRRSYELEARVTGPGMASGVEAPPLPHNAPEGESYGKVTDSFVESLIHRPGSSAVDSLEELSDHNKQVLLRSGGQLGPRSHGAHTSAPSIVDSVADSGRGTASVSMANSGMTLRERIAYIERQLSARESDSAREFNSEIDLTSWKAKVNDSNRKLEVAEKENKHFKDEHLKTRPAYRRKMKINKLERDLEEKTRLYMLLEAFLTTVETILSDKSIQDKSSLVSRLEMELERVKSGLSVGGQRSPDVPLEPAALNTELAKKERELAAKRNENDSLLCELRQWQQECRAIEDMRSNALDSLRVLEMEISELQFADRQLKDLKDDFNTLKGQFMKLVDTYRNLQDVQHKYEVIVEEKDDLDIEATGLRSKVKLLEGQIEVLEGVYGQKDELQEKISVMKEKLLMYEKIEIEKITFEKTLQGVTGLLNERMKKVESLTEEAFELRKKLSTTEREFYKLRQHNLNVRTVSSTWHTDGAEDEESGSRSKSPASTAGLRAKIVQLTSSCNEKDLLIKKLVQELKKLKSSAKSSPFLDELVRAESDYNHNKLFRSSSQSSLDSGEHGDHMSHFSDTEILRHSSPHHMARPHSADVSNRRNNSLPHRHGYGHSHRSSLPRSYRHHGNNISHGNHSDTVTNSSRSDNIPHPPHAPFRLHNNFNGTNGVDGSHSNHFVAIADYDPALFSQSGHQRLELSLKEGDIVSVRGEPDQNGYYEGEVNGAVGLVPASYLQPAPISRSGLGHRHGVPNFLNKSPEKIAQLYSHLQNAHQSNTHVPFSAIFDHDSEKLLKEMSKIDNLKIRDISNGDSNKPMEIHEIENSREGPSHHPSVNGIPQGSVELPSNTKFINHTMATAPQVPTNFHVEKIIGNSSLQLAWQQLPLDNKGCNNGSKVTGYRIFKNNKILVQPRGPLATKAIIENLDIHSHHRFGIVSVSSDGRVSELSEIMYEGVEEMTSDENSDTESEMDMSTMLDMDEYKNGHKRMFLSVYDYDPTKNSPQDNPHCELAFTAGDTITVYGRQRADGFYHGEINGVRGLVPGFFIEEIPQAPPRMKKIASRNKQTTKGSNKHES